MTERPEIVEQRSDPGRLTSTFAIEDFRKMFEAGPTPCVLVDDQGLIRDVNEEAERMLGYRRDELMSEPIEVLVPEPLRERHVRHRAEFQRARTARPMGVGLELFARRKDGSELPVEIALSPLGTSRGTYIVVSVNDIRQRKRLRAFGAGVLKGAEEERQRIARELHDDTAQALAALVLRLQMARRTDEAARRDELLGEMHREMLRAAEGVRRILRGLRPPALEEAGVVAAIRAQARGTLGEAGIDVEVKAGGIDDQLTIEGRLALYRIVQEALSNVVRHAHASRVTIDLTGQDGLVTATVEDDGRGFAVESVHQTEGGRGLGILGMQERATILGGSVRLESEAGRGTKVTVELPASG